MQIHWDAARNEESEAADSLVIEAEIKKLLDKGVIVPTQHESGEYISPTFVTNKKDGSSRMILNFKSFNQHVEYQIVTWRPSI